MLLLYKIVSKFLQMVLNLMFVMQILLLILVFLTAAYWFCDLLTLEMFNFAEPIAAAVSNFVRLFYQGNIEVGGIYVDGSLLLFDILSLLFVFIITKAKYYVYNSMSFVDSAIYECNRKIEEQFNEQLEKELEADMKAINNVAILVQFDAKNLAIDNCWGGNEQLGVREKQEEAFKLFYAGIKSITGCRFAKTGDKMLILLNNFEKIDNLLEFMNTLINRIRVDMKKNNWLLSSYIALDVYDNKSDFNGEVYPMLHKLVNLGHKNEAVCLSGFGMRYRYKKDPMYTAVLKGKYNINQEAQVWALVKKS